MVSTKTVATIFLVIWTNCAAAYTGADQLIKDCTVVPTKPEEAFRQTRCTGYVGGVLDAYGVVSGLYRNVNIYCAPQGGLTGDTAIGALVQWVRVHPDKAELPARSALLMALRDRYPCR
jgi:Rap1a immunity proteins